MVQLLDGEKVLGLFSHFDILPACDRRTNRQTDGRKSCNGHSPRYA